MDDLNTVYMTYGNTTLRTILHGKYSGHLISNNIYDIHIKKHVCRCINKTNTILCDCNILVKIHITFSMDLVGMENIYAKDLDVTSS